MLVARRATNFRFFAPWNLNRVHPPCPPTSNDPAFKDAKDSEPGNKIAAATVSKCLSGKVNRLKTRWKVESRFDEIF